MRVCAFFFFFNWSKLLQTVVSFYCTMKWIRCIYTHIHISPSSWTSSPITYSSRSGFPDSSVGKESACNAGDPSSIPESGRSPGEGIGYPLQDSWASLVAQLWNNLPAMQETWVRPLGWEDPPEKGMATHSSVLSWRILWTVLVHGVAKSWT